jgi:catechol 2,3-dioxygenase-like lactoylglutathione lyase family enzyme
MRIARIILRVTDLDRSIEFWSNDVGFSLAGRGVGFAFLDGGGVQLALNQVADLAEDSSLTELVLEVDDVRAGFDALKGRGVPFEVDLRNVMSEGDRDLLAAHFRDPDGHLASFTGWVAG